MSAGTSKRINWGKNYPHLPRLNLIEIQKESWKKFLEKDLAKTIKSISPISDYTGNNWELELKSLVFNPPVISPLVAQKRGINYSVPVEINVKLSNKRTGNIKEENVFFLNLPTMTQRGTFIINGIERGVINQLVRSPGIYFTGETDPSTGKTLYNAEIRPTRGSWLEFFVGKKGVIFARIDRKRKFPATILLRAACKMSDKDLVAQFSDYIATTIAADNSHTPQETVLEFYRKLRPGEPAVLENAQRFLRERFFTLRTYELGQVGRYKINKKFGFNFDDKDENNWVIKTKTYSPPLSI